MKRHQMKTSRLMAELSLLQLKISRSKTSFISSSKLDLAKPQAKPQTKLQVESKPWEAQPKYWLCISRTAVEWANWSPFFVVCVTWAPAIFIILIPMWKPSLSPYLSLDMKMRTLKKANNRACNFGCNFRQKREANKEMCLPTITILPLQIILS